MDNMPPQSEERCKTCNGTKVIPDITGIGQPNRCPNCITYPSHPDTLRRHRKTEVSAGLYQSVHYWLKKKYGKADRCENKKCLGASKNYDWALIHGKKYDYIRGNFFRLCKGCHNLYDVTPYKRLRMRELNPHTHQKHCKRGHAFTPDNINTYIDKRNGNVNRHCRKCETIRLHKRWLAIKENRLISNKRKE